MQPTEKPKSNGFSQPPATSCDRRSVSTSYAAQVGRLGDCLLAIEPPFQQVLDHFGVTGGGHAPARQLQVEPRADEGEQPVHLRDLRPALPLAGIERVEPPYEPVAVVPDRVVARSNKMLGERAFAMAERIAEGRTATYVRAHSVLGHRLRGALVDDSDHGSASLSGFQIRTPSRSACVVTTLDCVWTWFCSYCNPITAQE